MFGVSFTELILIFVVALIVFGPEKLPEIAREIGKVMGFLRRQSDQLRREFYNTVYTPSEGLTRGIQRELKAVKSELEKATDPTTLLATPAASETPPPPQVKPPTEDKDG